MVSHQYMNNKEQRSVTTKAVTKTSPKSVCFAPTIAKAILRKIVVINRLIKNQMSIINNNVIVS